ncbi:MAG: sigma-70 family RNA polymerase sigma factor [Solirubrobacteraceae bacterium]|jgi:RNA polymerase sigma-B factor
MSRNEANTRVEMPLQERDPDAALFAALREHGDRAARDALIGRHLPLARNLARRYAFTPQPLEDLVQIASLGLVKAVDRFDPGRGTSFVAFAVPTIVGELRRGIRDAAWAVHVPRSLQERVMAIEQADRRLASQPGAASPTAQELAVEAGLTVDEVLDAFGARLARDSVPLDGEAAETMRRDPALETAPERVALEDALRQVPERELTILRLRFTEGLTQSEIAERVGLSQVRVSRLLRATLDSLRAGIS